VVVVVVVATTVAVAAHRVAAVVVGAEQADKPSAVFAALGGVKCRFCHRGKFLLRRMN
jgi:cytochrome c553